MKNSIDISIVIPAYNEEKFLKKSVESSLKQKTNLKYEIIVVDNCSNDNTYKIAKDFGVKVLKEKNKGVGWARKTGTEFAKGDIIVHIDADTIIPRDHLNRVWEHFSKDSELVCLGGQFTYYDGPKWKELLRKVLYKPVYYFGKTVSRGSLGPTGGNMAFKKKAYELTQGFDSSLKFGEDGDLSIKLKKVGKIKVDMSLKCEVSARRFYLDKKFLIYSINFLYLCFRGKPYKNVLPEHED